MLQEEYPVHHPVVHAEVIGSVSVQTEPVDVVGELAGAVGLSGEGLALHAPLAELEPLVGVVVPVDPLHHRHEGVLVGDVRGEHDAALQAAAAEDVTGRARGLTDLRELVVALAHGGVERGARDLDLLEVGGDPVAGLLTELLVRRVVVLGEGLGIHQPVGHEAGEVFHQLAVLVGRGGEDELPRLGVPETRPQTPACGSSEGRGRELQQRLALPAVREHVGAALGVLDPLQGVAELIPGGRLGQAELLEHVGAQRHRVVGACRFQKTRQQVELTVLLPQRIDLVLEAPVLDLLLEVRQQIDVVRDREDHPGGDILGFLAGIGDRDDRGCVTGTDEQAAPLVVVAQRGLGHREGDVVALLRGGQQQPVLLVGIVRVVAVEHVDLERLGRDEGLAGAVVVHRCDPLVVEVDRLLVAAVAAGAAAPVVVTAAAGCQAGGGQSDRESADEGASLHGHGCEPF